MFYALALALCLAVFFIVVAISFLFCAAGLYSGNRWLHFLPTRPRANVLFLLRAVPFILGILVTVGFTLPAFLRFEPRASHEMIGPGLLTLASLGAFKTAGIGIRMLRIIRATRRAQQQWQIHSRRLHVTSADVPVYCTTLPAPLFAVTGIFRPKIFVAQAVIEKLSPAELDAALAHELAHMSTLDNLKQLLLKATTVSRLNLFADSNAMWLNTAEMAADEGALARGVSALDLSSALVKVGGLSRLAPASSLIAASHLLPITAPSCLETRVNHLRRLLESEDLAAGVQAGRKNYWPAFFLFFLVAGYAICVNSMLPHIHEALELLVR